MDVCVVVYPDMYEAVYMNINMSVCVNMDVVCDC